MVNLNIKNIFDHEVYTESYGDLKINKKDSYDHYLKNKNYQTQINKLIDIPWIINFYDEINSPIESEKIFQNMGEVLLSPHQIRPHKNLEECLKDIIIETTKQYKKAKKGEFKLSNERKKINLTYIIHCFYQELLPHHIERLNLSEGDKIIINFCSPITRENQYFIYKLCIYKKTKIETTYSNPNLRDWGGFRSCVENLKANEYVFISHCKRSPQTNKEFTKAWITNMIDDSVGIYNRTNNLKILSYKNNNVGIISSYKHRDQGLHKNYKKYHLICDSLKIPRNNREVSYLAGAYFLTKSDLLIKYFSKCLDESKFNEIGFETDGTYAHAHERAFFTFVRNEGYKTIWRDQNNLFE